uniref:G-protein coupled receptors family 1 profile domain-containing protein n=1 Tax=Plectus sambesii TaxID=2011161 RepID=A0A914WUH0_9BILA
MSGDGESVDWLGNESGSGEGAECTGLSVECHCHTHYQFYEAEEKLLLGLVALPIIAFGVCANLTSVKVFTHKLMRSSSINWYLAVLSCSDTFTLISAFFVLALPRVGEFFRHFGATQISYWTTPYMYALMVLAQTVSVYMTVLMSVHRFIGVCFPFKAQNVLSRGRVKMAIGAVLIGALLFNTTRFFEVRVVGTCFRYNINTTMPVLVPTALRLNATYRQLFFGWAYTIVMFVLPFVSLIIVNSMVIFAVHRSRRLHAGLSTGDDTTKKQELAKEISTSIMLVGIVVVFLACNTLAFVVNILENLEETSALYQSLVSYSNLLVIINASINILIYCLFSDKYRLLLKYYLCCYWSREGEMLLTAYQYHA